MLRNDSKRVFITYRYSSILPAPKAYKANDDFFSFLHPEIAKILALFNGENELEDIITAVISAYGVDREKAEKLVFSLIENKKSLAVTFAGEKFGIPENIVVKAKEGVDFVRYDAGQFDCPEMDFTTQRLFTYPLDVTFMVNTICLVDCIYCYADCRKKIDCQIPRDKIEHLIRQCRENGVRTFDLMGGEVLMYKHWKWLVGKMKEYGYTPYLSTKIPVKKEVVDELLELGLSIFQISLDSFDPDKLAKNLNIPNADRYLDLMYSTLDYCQAVNLSLNIHAVITQHNKGVEHLEAYLDKLSCYPNINSVQLSPVGDSMYKPGYLHHKLSREEIRCLQGHVDRIKSRYKFKISVSNVNY